MGFRTLRELGHNEKSVQLIDTPDTIEFTHNIHLHGENVVLVPQPSDDLNDPLRWPTWKKYFAFLNVCLFAFMTTGFISGFSPALYGLSLEFKRNVSATTSLVTWPLLVLGLGNFFWVPTAEYFGKRPVFVIASLISFCCIIWSAVSSSFNSLLASRVVAAFGGSSTEALGAAVVNDIFFLHERGAKMGIYIIFLYCGNSVGSLVAGFVIDGAGWRWFSWLCAIISGVNFVAIFLFVHETRFGRTVDATGSLSDAGDSEKNSLSQTTERKQSTIEPRSNTISIAQVGTKKTPLQKLSLWSGTSKESYMSHFLRPFLLVAYPAVVWGILAYSLCLAWQISANSLSSFVFQLPPYNFSPGVNGLINIPAIIGNLLGAFTGGYLTDVYARYSAVRNSGRFSPESRLLLLIFPGLLVPVGLLMFGFGAEQKLHWAVLFVGYAFINVVNGVASIAMTYVMDSYFEVAAEALLMVNGMKNIIGWGFTYGFIPWTASAGYETVFGAMAGIWLAVMLMAVPFYLFGVRIRNYTTTKMRVIFW